MNVKLFFGYAFGTIAFTYAIYAGHSIGVDATASTLNVLICVAGGVSGWITGILITPREGEVRDFAKIGGALFTFVTGFLLAKIEPLFDAQVEGSEPNTVLIVALLFGVCFGVGALFIFVGRKYWQGDT